MKIFVKSIPTWIILLIDILIVGFSVILAYLVRFNFSIPELEIIDLPIVLSIIIFIRLISFLIFGTYSGLVRFTSSQDIMKIFLVLGAGSLGFVSINIITYYLVGGKFILPFSIIIIELISTIFAMTFFRIIVRLTYMDLLNPSREKANVIIFGAGEAGLIAKMAMDRDAGTKYKVLAFVDDNAKKIGKKIENVRIVGGNKLEDLLKNQHIEHLILAVQNIDQIRKQGIIELCLKYNTKVLNVPPVDNWINGELSFKQIKKIHIEDLLERPPIKLDEKQICNDITRKTILITGAAGSIGSEIVRQVANYSPQQIICVDQAESPLYILELELAEIRNNIRFETILCDVRNKIRMEKIFKEFKPQIIYHAAAYKHVPMLENHPSEALLTNIEGTKTVADLAVKYQTLKFIMISTDKAVNPTNVMGASKRIAEIYTQSLNEKQITRFITTRFGNVLGSNGSVIPLFTKQIEDGGPIKITHPNVTRYFMTIPEACQLVLEAGAMGKGGEIFIFDMGKSVKIVDLAKKMIKLSRLTLGKDIQIIYTGLRPGEKLYEELFFNEENSVITHNPQIMVLKVREYDSKTVENEISKLIQLIVEQDNFKIVSAMKKMVPEFISKNSLYEQLDKQS